jgi:hypothetical protein
MNLLIISDNIFYPSLLERLEVLGLAKNNAVVCVNRAGKEYDFLSAGCVPFVEPREFAASLWAEKAQRYRAIYLFTIGSWLAPWVASIPPGPKVCWIMMDGVYLNMARRVGRTLGANTREFYESRGLLPAWRENIPELHRRAVARVDAFSGHLKVYKTWLQDDFQIQPSEFFDFDFPLSGLSFARGETPERPARLSAACRHILLGNSSALSNNYIEGLDALAGLDLPADVRIVPQLGYGGDGKSTPILAYGRDLLGDALYPLTETLPQEEHNALLCHADAAVMPFYRSQGGLNVKKLLYYGKKVFLSEHNPMYVEFQVELGTLGLFEEMTAENLLEPLTPSEKKRQKEFILAKYEQDGLDDTYMKLFG